MVSTGYASDDKVHSGGDSMTGTLSLLGTPPLTIPAGASSGYVATSDGSGNVYWAPGGGGGLLLGATSTKTANYPAIAGDLVIADISGGNFTVTLPSAPPNFTLVGVKITAYPATGTGTLTVQRGGTDHIDNSATTSVTCTTLNQARLFQYSTASGIWTIIAGDLSLTQLDHRYPKVFNLLAYGGKGDGTTNNSPAYVAALTAINAAGGGILYIPAGTYYSSLPLSPTASNIAVAGDGIDLTVLLPSVSNTGANGDGIRVAQSPGSYLSQISVRDLTVDCSAAYPAGQLGSTPGSYSNGITMQGVDYLRIERVKIIKPFGYGVAAGAPGASAPDVQSPVIRDLTVEGERGGFDSLGGGGCRDGLVDGLYVHPAADGTNPYGTATDWTNLRNTTIRNVRAWTTFVYGISASSTPSLPPGATQLANPYAFPVTITFPTGGGGNLTNVTINGVSLTPGLSSYTLPGFGTISLSYTVSPTWQWDVPAAPAVPLTTVPVTNPFPYPVPVTLTGGTVSAVVINGVTQGTTTGYFLVPLNGTITLTYSSAPAWAWATTGTAGALMSDFGAADVLYDDLYINGFHDGVIISKPVNRRFPSNITVRNARFINIGIDGFRTNVYTGYGIHGIKILDCYFDTYGMLAAGAGIVFNGTTGFSICNNTFGAYTTSSYAVNLATDGVNVCDDGVVTGNDLHGVGVYTIATGSGGDIGRNVSISGNPGYNPVGPLTAPGVPATTVAYTNPFGVACAVFITGGTVTAVAIGGTSTGLTSGMFRVPAGQTIKLTYSSAPTWTWFGD